jgi:hypothetical protein
MSITIKATVEELLLTALCTGSPPKNAEFHIFQRNIQRYSIKNLLQILSDSVPNILQYFVRFLCTIRLPFL